MFTINGKDMAELLRFLHVAHLDSLAFIEAEETESMCEDHLADLANNSASSAAMLCATIEMMLFNKDNWKGE